MRKLTKKELNKKYKKDNLLDGLSDELKTTEKFDEIEAKLLDLIKTDHKHKTAKQYVKCIECMQKRDKRNELIKSFGFKNYLQYLQWKKIHTIIKNKQNFQI